MSVKSGVLELLEGQRGNYVSGEEIAEKLSCSRAAVCKAVKSLRKEGYQIASGTNKGYTLEVQNDILSEVGIHRYLAQEYPVIVFKEIDSTNRVLKQRIVNSEDKVLHGTVVAAEEQTQGKGRKGRSFTSPRGGLYLSVLLRPEKTMKQGLVIRAAAAVAVFRAIKKMTGMELDIHWVNDLYYKNEKICGVLTEVITDFETGDLEYAIVGIGILLGGLEKQTEFHVERNQLAAEIVNCLLEEVKKEQVSEIYMERNRVLGKEMVLAIGEKKKKVFVQKILPDGSLCVSGEEGEEILPYGELEFPPEKLGEEIEKH